MLYTIYFMNYGKVEHMKLRLFFITILVTILLTTNLLVLHALAAEAEPVRVAIIDTGISEIAINKENLLPGQNYILPVQATADTIGHGTAVASIIAGSERAGLEGLCLDVKLVPLVYYLKSENGSIVKGNADMLAQIIRDAVNVFKCKIINISSGVMTDTPALRDAVTWAEKNGVLIISSAGNDGNDTIYYPGAYSTVLCVGAANEEQNGPAGFSNRHEAVGILAPGKKLPAATMKGNQLQVSGTSYATAYVSGIAAKLMNKYPGLTAKQVRRILCTSATDSGTAGYDIESGWGILNIDKALVYARQNRLLRIFDPLKWYFESVSKGIEIEIPQYETCTVASIFKSISSILKMFSQIHKLRVLF